MLAVAFGNYVCSSLTIGIFLYVAQTVESVLAVAFGNKLCWFESHYRHISVCSPGSWTHASSRLRKQTMLVQVPLSAYFFTYPYDWKHLLMWIVGCASMMGVALDPGWFCSCLISGVCVCVCVRVCVRVCEGVGGMKDCWKMCSSNFSFPNKLIIFLSYGFLVDSNTF